MLMTNVLTTQISMMTPHYKKYIQLPASLKAVKDICLHAAPTVTMALLACTGNCLAVVTQDTVTHQIQLNAPCHSCAWAPGSLLDVYAGGTAFVVLPALCLQTAG